jgi:hypothetical protein
MSAKDRRERWITAAQAYTQDEGAAKELEQQMELEKQQRARDKQVSDFGWELTGFRNSEEFPAAIALLKAADRTIFLGERAGLQYVLSAEGFQRLGGLVPETVSNMNMNWFAEVFYQWKGFHLSPVDFLRTMLDEIAREAPQPVTAT